ncbi:MarR family winged helix-turn-helix transcriptional regulator [Gynuella sp.]|uniref:MarR family winged helix-turn-helix transcriptional regulator n=1 Tax=Gynuella sp. TaxID=2969146 RepID=UPI003D13D6B8
MPQDLAHQLAVELRHLIARSHRKLKEQANLGDLSWTQERVLIHLYRHAPATVSDLAVLEGMRSQSMGATVNTLKQAGYVIGQSDPNDGRKTLLYLSDEFKRHIRQKRLAGEEWLESLISQRLTEREQKTLKNSLKAFKKLLQDE